MIKPCRCCGKDYNIPERSWVCLPCQIQKQYGYNKKWNDKNPNYYAELRQKKREERDMKASKDQYTLDLDNMRFNGPNAEHDQARLVGQVQRVFNCMRDGVWRTLSEIEGITGDPQASISAQLRHLRKERFGSHSVEKRLRGEHDSGLWEYRLDVNNG